MEPQINTCVVDASVLINLLATGFAKEILEAIPYRFVAAEQAMNEVKGHPREPKSDRRPTSVHMNGLVSVVGLTDESSETFLSLIQGDLDSGLGDGESATLAIAHHEGFVAVIDERKATSICRRRFPAVRCISTVDLLRRQEVVEALHGERYASAVCGALEYARMSVHERHIDWLRDIVGDKACRYNCISRRNMLTENGPG